MKVITVTEASRLIPELPATFERRHLTGPDDWGDFGSITAAVRRRGKDFYNLDGDKDFGRYLGNNIVGIFNLNMEFTSCEQYDTEAEMHKEWILD